MPILTIHHRTEYRYARPVSFGEHRIMLRPRDGHDLRVLAEQLGIQPRPVSARFFQDVYGNTIGLVNFAGPSDKLVFDSKVKVDHRPTRGLQLSAEDYAFLHPFAYDDDEMPELAASMQRAFEDPDRKIGLWARQFVRSEGETPTQDLLAGITRAIHRDFVLRRTYQAAVQDPLETLRTGMGTSRDFAMLMIEAVRSLGYAARFVTGYRHMRGGEKERVGGGSTHSWVAVYLPGKGWAEFDPTNGLIGNVDLIPVAVARAPHQAVLLSGTYTGSASDHLEMKVNIRVVSETQS